MVAYGIQVKVPSPLPVWDLAHGLEVIIDLFQKESPDGYMTVHL